MNETDPNIAARQRWMGVLARAGSALDAHEAALKDSAYQLIRAPEVGMTLVRGRMGGTGSAFNLGEMTVTRCSVRLTGGAVGHAWVQGRDRDHARRAAVLDALMQTDAADALRIRVIGTLAAEAGARQAARADRAEATRVEFFTMVRGEDA